jgi:hypothetical protein
VAHWIGLVNGFSNLVSKINKVEIYILNGSVKGEIYAPTYIYVRGSKGVEHAEWAIRAQSFGKVVYVQYSRHRAMLGTTRGTKQDWQ